MNYSIITCIMNDYEVLHEVQHPLDNVEYILVTDNKLLKSNTWKIIYEPLLDTDDINGITKSFYVKYNSYKYVSNEYFIRLDAKFTITSSFDDMINDMVENDIDYITFLHAYTYNLYSEYKDWLLYRGQDKKFEQRFSNKMSIYYYNYQWNGLFGTTILFCRNTLYVQDFFHDMLNSVITYTNNGIECDNNDLCYMTVLLMSKYNTTINTKVISWTICNSKYIYSNYHGTDVIDNNCDIIYDKHLHWYWQGKDMGELEDLLYVR